MDNGIRVTGLDRLVFGRLLNEAFGPSLGREDEYSFWENYRASAARSIGADILGELSRPAIGQSASRDVSYIARRSMGLRAMLNGEPHDDYSSPAHVFHRAEWLGRRISQLPDSIQTEQMIDHALEQIAEPITSVDGTITAQEIERVADVREHLRQRHTPDFTRVLDNSHIQAPLVLGSFAVHLMSNGELMKQPLSLRTLISR